MKDLSSNPRSLLTNRPLSSDEQHGEKNEELKMLITDLETTIQELRDSKKSFLKLAHHAPALIYISLPEEDRLLFVNARYEEYIGYTQEECLSIRSWDLIHPDYRELLKRESLAMKQDRTRISRQEIKIITRDGRELWQDLSKCFIEYEGYEAVLGIAYDITERKQAEALVDQQHQELQASYSQLEAMNEEIIASQDALLALNKQLQESQERLELALWGSNEGFWDWNFSTGGVVVNDFSILMLGYGPDEIKKDISSFYLLAHPADIEETWVKLKEHLQGKTPCYEIEYRLKNRDGSWTWVFDRGKVVEWDEHHRATRIVGMRRDITEYKKAQDAIIEARNRYSTLIEAIPEIVVQLNLNDEFEWVNDVAREFYGDTVLGTSIQNYFLEQGEFELLKQGFQRLWDKSQSTLAIKNWQRHRNGELRLLNWQVKPLYQEQDLIGNLATARDITEIHRAEERIRYLSFNDSLTGLYNRAFVTEELKRLDTARQLPLSIIMGDVNALKLTNDAFGHAEGDRLLITIAEILRQASRQEDIVARWGGDEFLILLPQTSQKDACAMCQRIQKFCLEAPYDPIQPSIALGAACKESVDQRLEEILAEAENSMYRNKLLEGKSLRNSIISSLEQSLNERTHETREHAERMQEISIAFAQALELPVNECERLILLAKLHDIGKLGIPDSILAKPGTLDPEEWEMIKKHPEIGYRITQASHDLTGVAEEILSHHEKWDGSGYPRGLKGEEIPYLARMITIVDSYDVMTHGRPYKPAVSSLEALQEIRRCSEGQFDPQLVDVFLDFFQQSK